MTRGKHQILPPRFRNQTSNIQEYDLSKPSPAYSRRGVEAGRKKLGELEVGRRERGEIGVGRRNLEATGAGRREFGAGEMGEGRREPGDMEVLGRREPGRMEAGQRKFVAIEARRREPRVGEIKVERRVPGDMRVRQRETITIGVTREPIPVDHAARHQFCSRRRSASSIEDDISPVLDTRQVSPVLDTRQVSWTRSTELNKACSLTVYVTSNSFRRKPPQGGDSRSFNNSRGRDGNISRKLNSKSSNGLQGWKKHSTYKSSNPTHVQIKTVHDDMTVQAEVLNWIRKQWDTTAAQLRNKTVNYYR